MYIFKYGPTLEFDSVNLTPANSGEAMYYLKELLKAAGWAVVSSGTGTSGTFGSSDLWSSGSVANNTNAWIVLKQPTGGSGSYMGTRQISFQRGSIAGQWRIAYSVSSGYSVTGSTAILITSSNPADEKTVFGSGSAASPVYSTLFGADGGYRFNAGADNASPFTFYAFAFPSGGGTVRTGVLVEAAASGSAPVEDSDPFVLWAYYNATANVFTTSYLAESTSNGPLGWLKRGTAGADFVRIPFCYYRESSTSNAIVPGGLNTNPHNSKDDLFPPIMIRSAGLTDPDGYKGVCHTVRWIGKARALGDLLTKNAAGDYVVVGDCALPWNNTTLLI